MKNYSTQHFQDLKKIYVYFNLPPMGGTDGLGALAQLYWCVDSIIAVSGIGDSGADGRANPARATGTRLLVTADWVIV